MIYGKNMVIWCTNSVCPKATQTALIQGTEYKNTEMRPFWQSKCIFENKNDFNVQQVNIL